jgi:hypothetical protein
LPFFPPKKPLHDWQPLIFSSQVANLNTIKTQLGFSFFFFHFPYIKNFAWFSKNRNISQNHTKKREGNSKMFPNFVDKRTDKICGVKKSPRLWSTASFIFQFCEVGGLAIIHNHASPNLVTLWRSR